MSEPREGKWTRTPPGGDVCFVYDRAALREFITHAQKVHEARCAKAKELGEPEPCNEAHTFPRVAQRIVQDDGTVVWLLAGSSTLWPEDVLLKSKKLVWWSKPHNIPKIPFLLAKEITCGEE
jgi:hypothetical protein